MNGQTSVDVGADARDDRAGQRFVNQGAVYHAGAFERPIGLTVREPIARTPLKERRVSPL